MGAVEPIHILIVVIVLLVLFGAKRIPDLGRSMGQSISGFKKGLSEDLPPEQEARQSTAVVETSETPDTVAADH